jgi:epoxide hydrolase-like predicted phosphatase
VLDGKELRGVVTDWGGVLTTPILTTVRAWVRADGIDWDTYAGVMAPWIAGAYQNHGVAPNPVHALERGECSNTDFEVTLAALLKTVDGGPVPAEGLLRRMFAAAMPVPAMYGVIRTLRGAGFGTALLSNSWGCDEYPRADFPGLFDTVVISAEVGMRKPEPEIFLHAAATLGLEPKECVFIDDVEANVAAAMACGMAGVHHTDPAVTARELEALLGVELQVRK